ncbi:MAG: hypothetical protein DMF78_05255 [Acidobacteria bacterium]|nr:MAG: hypothetical protein DMF78_05255 [Acidobacteriota bacterium]
MKLVDKLEKALPAIEARRGPFLLVGLFLREESPGPWDLVVSAPWLEDRKLRTLDALVKYLSEAAGKDFIQDLSRIVTLDAHSDVVRSVLAETRRASLPLHKVGRDLFGLPVEEAYVLRAQTAARNVRELAAR